MGFRPVSIQIKSRHCLVLNSPGVLQFRKEGIFCYGCLYTTWHKIENLKMSTENFRRELRDESAQWRQEGLIDSELFEHLRQRYQLDQLESGSSNRFTAVLLGLGGILLGLGVITLVAANWQAWPRLLRVVVIFSAFLGVNAAGFYVWQRTEQQSGSGRLGNGLLLAGALLMGANIGLMSQMFHQSGSVDGLYLVWGLGVLVMAYSLRLTALGVLSWILIFMSYWGANVGSAWGGQNAEVDWIAWLTRYLPILITPLYLPLAHGCRSRALYGIWGVGLMTLLPSALTVGQLNPVLQTLTIMLPPALLWVYRAQFGRRPSDRFESIGRSLSIWFVSIATYAYSFRMLWTNAGQLSDGPEFEGGYLFLIGLAGLWAIAAYGGWQWFLRWRSRSPGESLQEPRELWMKTPVFAVVLLILGVAVFCQLQGFFGQLGSAFVFGPLALNLLLFFIGFALLHDGILLGIRQRFWGGMGIVVIGLVTRMFEYDTDLLLKALVLAVCGIGIIVAGLWFEKKARQSATLLSPPSVSS